MYCWWTLDTTRADRLGCYGHAVARTPALDGLAASSVRFEKAYCQVPLTLPSHTGMLTGTYPPTNGIHVNGAAIVGKDIPTLAEAFQKRGYRTGAFLSAWVLNAAFGLGRGFDHYDDQNRRRERRRANSIRNARRIEPPTRRWPGWPKSPPRSSSPGYIFSIRTTRTLPHHRSTGIWKIHMHGEIAFMDSQFARLLNWLELNKLRERTLNRRRR